MIDILIKIIFCFIGSMAAGLGTGFAGMSAAVAITPMLVVFLDVPIYEAVGIALASDVLASGISAFTYYKSKNVDIKNGILMMVAVLALTTVGSYVGSLVPAMMMEGCAFVVTIIMGIRFIVKPIKEHKKSEKSLKGGKKIAYSLIAGACVGFVCGFVGAGGGMVMLFMLTSVLGYELKKAVGTSVFIMTFTALTGAISHFSIGGSPNILCLFSCVVFTLLWARIASKMANKLKPITLNRVTGIILMAIGFAVGLAELYKVLVF